MSDERQEFIDGMGDALREYKASQKNIRRIMTPMRKVEMMPLADDIRIPARINMAGETIPDYDDGPRTLEDMEMMERLAEQEAAPVAPTTRRPYPNEMSRTVTHPDGFVEFDEEVFPDPERDQIMADTMRAFREAAAKRAMEAQRGREEE